MKLDSVSKSLVVWLGILLFAVANGAARELVLIPLIGRHPALILSGVSLCALILLLAYLSVRWFGHAPRATYVAVGLIWLGLTVTFELGFGHFVQGKTWSQLLDAYSFAGGNLWPVVSVVTAVAPYWAARVRGLVR